MQDAREVAERFAIRHVLVATNTGRSLRRAQAAFGPGYVWYAVGNPAGAHERGLVQHCGVSEETCEELAASGVHVVLRDRSPLQCERVRYLAGSLSHIDEETRADGVCNALALLYSTLQLLSDGPRVCIEIALMAADAGILPLDEDCLAIACPSAYCDLPDAAVVMRPARSEELFQAPLRVKHIALAPTENDVWFSNGPLP
jgi:uncharacterized protein